MNELTAALQRANNKLHDVLELLRRAKQLVLSSHARDVASSANTVALLETLLVSVVPEWAVRMTHDERASLLECYFDDERLHVVTLAATALAAVLKSSQGVSFRARRAQLLRCLIRRC